MDVLESSQEGKRINKWSCSLWPPWQQKVETNFFTHSPGTCHVNMMYKVVGMHSISHAALCLLTFMLIVQEKQCKPLQKRVLHDLIYVNLCPPPAVCSMCVGMLSRTFTDVYGGYLWRRRLGCYLLLCIISIVWRLFIITIQQKNYFHRLWC